MKRGFPTRHSGLDPESRGFPGLEDAGFPLSRESPWPKGHTRTMKMGSIWQTVTPAEAGVQRFFWARGRWIPACAGMTTWGHRRVYFHSNSAWPCQATSRAMKMVPTAGRYNQGDSSLVSRTRIVICLGGIQAHKNVAPLPAVSTHRKVLNITATHRPVTSQEVSIFIGIAMAQRPHKSHENGFHVADRHPGGSRGPEVFLG